MFVNNLPGDRWLRSFATRNQLSARVTSDIKRARVSVSEATINDFFDELRAGGVEDTPPSHVFNFDETNFTDDPGAKKCFVRRSSRRVEIVREHSKTAISVMWCGSADGIMQPPMVVYKALNLYDGWTTGGPRGTAYDCTPSGGLIAALSASGLSTSFCRVLLRSAGQCNQLGSVRADEAAVAGHPRGVADGDTEEGLLP